jgi:uncharacterized membrane protein (DUF4010 family)
MALFFGLAFENFYAGQATGRPGGIRTFPMLALAGAACYALAPDSGLIFAAGLVALALWLFGYNRSAPPGEGPEFIVPVCNLLAYLIGALALAQPPWVVVAVAVAATLLLAGRTRLHALAQNLPIAEIFTAAQFLLLVGVALPLLPDTPVAGFGELTAHRVLLAVVAVSALSYASYLLARYVRPKNATLFAAVLGGLYSSTATTVVLARRCRGDEVPPDSAAGIVLATALMYVRLLAIVAVFNAALASELIVPLLALFIAGLALAVAVDRALHGNRVAGPPVEGPANPLQLGAALLFAALFVVVTIATAYARARFGGAGVNALALVVGFTDIDPFVLSLAQGNALALPGAAAAILIATASNNVLKAAYAYAFGARGRMLAPMLALLALAAGSVGAAGLIAR